MSKLATAAIALLTFTIAAPAGARIAGRHPQEPVRPANPFIGNSRLPGPSIGRDLRDIRSQVERARSSGELSTKKARRLKREARQIGRLARRYGRDGLSEAERSELEARAHYLRDAVKRPGK